MKKLGLLVMPLMAVSLLASCGGSKKPTKVSYTLTYTYDNDSDDKYVETYDEDKKTVKPTWEPTYSGYTFDGWFTKPGTEGSLFTFGDILTTNTVVFAHWSDGPTPIVSHKLVYNFDNGTSETYTETYVGSKETKKPAWTPGYDGHTFVGWYLDEGEGEEGSKFTFDEPLTLEETNIHAHWTVTPVPPTTYHLTFNGTNCKMDGKDIYEEDIPVGATTQRKIYPDEGYALPIQGQGEELTIKGDGASSITYENGNIIITEFSGDVEITANPSLKDCVVSFNANGGDLIGSPTITVSYGTKFSEITDIESHEAEKNLYIFNGWALTPSDKKPLSADNDYDIKGDLELYAILVPQNTIKLTFNGTNCRLWKNDIMQEGIIDIIFGVDNLFTIEPIDSYLPVFLTPVTSTNTIKCEFDPSTKQLIVNANQNCSVNASTTKQSLEECTWSEIKSISEAGLADDFFDIGETKTVTINTKIHNVRIIDFDHDKDSEGNNLGITFEFANVITDSNGAVTTYWNYKDELKSTNYDYRESTLNDFLNDTGDDGSIINMLPSSSDPNNPDLREVIKPANKLVGVSFDEGDSYNAIPFEEGKLPKLFALAYNEMHDLDDIQVAPGEAGDPATGGGIYEYYKGHGGDKTEDAVYRVKKMVDGEGGSSYWLRSPMTVINLGVGAWGFGYNGILGNYYVCFGTYAVAPAFCI